MTRPQIIRADSIDLQDHNAPSAKDHKLTPSKSTSNSNANANGSLAPHQAGTIREVEEERAEEEARSPRVSWANGDGDNDRDLQLYAEELASGIVNSLNGSKMQQQDALAIAQNGGVVGHADDDGDIDVNTDDEDLDDDMMDKISSSPSIEDEDIDFEFVYALHTFVATVEGQANATKGDTMVLLDDSNSYWWLVRVVKDSSIGYLPAEHIETPTERLARLNKHRNIDLSATMLGDQSDKARNPIMTAMKRRKAKNVSFAPPTVVNYAEIEYSDEESEEEDGQDPQQASQQEDQQQQANSEQATADVVEEDESAKVEPLKPRTQKQVKIEPAGSEEADKGEPSAKEPASRNSDEIFDGKTERTTKNGTVRNTDSFFRDETIETKKITLTPGLLRDDNEARVSNDSTKDLRQRPSLEKELVPDKSKDDKKRKEKEKKDTKKPSVIRSFFSRKDKKKSLDDDDESFGKRSMDAGTGYGDADMAEEPEEMEASPPKSPQRNPSKLQKQQPRTELSPTRNPGIISTVSTDPDRFAPLAAEIKTNNVASVPPATVRMVDSEQPENQGPQGQKDENGNPGAPQVLLTDAESKPLNVTKAKSRVELDDFDFSAEEEAVPAPTRAPPAEPKREPTDEELPRPSLPGSFPDSSTSIPLQSEATEVRPSAEDLSESPVQVSPLTPSNPPALVGDTSSQEGRSSPVSSPSPELADADSSTPRNQDSVAPSVTATNNSTWNDANLRAFFDSGSEIRDLLVVVYDDKTDVPPVGPNNPIANSLFREQNAKLAEITTQLDNMLGDWLARKQRLRGTV